jgi:hypothetical protein
MKAVQIRPVRVVLHVPVTDFVMSGYDENGAMYRTVVLGHRTFAKVVDTPPRSSIRALAGPRADQRP